MIFCHNTLRDRKIQLSSFLYVVHGRIPMTINDATRFASIITRSNCNLQELNSRFIKKTMEESISSRTFTAVLDKGIPGFYDYVPVTAGNSYYKKSIQRACNAGNSKLATNTTFNCLGIYLIHNEEIELPSIHFNDDDINPLLPFSKSIQDWNIFMWIVVSSYLQQCRII